MKKILLILLLSIFLYGCAPIGLQSEATSKQTQAAEPTPTQKQKPIASPTSEPSPTAEPQVTYLEGIQIGGIFYEPVTLLFDPNIWTIGENEFDKILELINNPGCKIYENIPRGLPGDQSIEAETLEQKMGSYNLTLTKYTRDGEVFFTIFNFYDELISIVVEPNGDDPDKCFNAAWTVIETSAENAFSPLD